MIKCQRSHTHLFCNGDYKRGRYCSVPDNFGTTCWSVSVPFHFGTTQNAMSCSGSPPIPSRYHHFSTKVYFENCSSCIALIVPPTRAAFDLNCSLFNVRHMCYCFPVFGLYYVCWWSGVIMPEHLWPYENVGYLCGWSYWFKLETECKENLYLTFWISVHA